MAKAPAIEVRPSAEPASGESVVRLGERASRQSRLRLVDASADCEAGVAVCGQREAGTLSGGRRDLAGVAAEAACRAPGVASLADSGVVAGASAGDAPGVVARPSLDGKHQDLRVCVRAYLGDFLELGWVVRDAIRRAAALHGLSEQLGLIDVQVVAIVLPIEELPTA